MQRYRPLRKIIFALNNTYKAETALYSLHQVTQNYEINCNLSHVKRGLPVFLLKSNQKAFMRFLSLLLKPPCLNNA